MSAQSEKIATYQAQIESALAGANLSGESPLLAGGRVQGIIADQVIRAVRQAIRDKVDTPEERAAIASAALAAFDSWDIPRIGGYVETTAKAFIRPFLAAMIGDLLALAADKLAEV